MDRAARNFLALAAIAVALAAYGICGLLGYGIVPLLDGDGPHGIAAVTAALALAAVVVVAAARGIRSSWRRAAAGRELSRRVSRSAGPIPTRLALAARESRLGDRVTLIDSESPCSFVHGVLAPRVVISTGLLARLSDAELRAALEHERYHVESLDPLRDALAEVAVDAIFFLPALRTLGTRYAAARELAADRRAVALVGPRALAGALLKAMEEAPAARPAAIALAAPRSIEARLDQLETGREALPPGVDPGTLGATALGAAAFLALLVAAPLAVGGAGDLSRELGPAGLLEGALYCLAPIAVVGAATYRRLSSRVLR